MMPLSYVERVLSKQTVTECQRETSDVWLQSLYRELQTETFPMTNTMTSVGTVRVLPRPAAASMSLTDALASRRSVRDYAETPVTDEKLAYILWAAAGITAEDGSRTVPSTMHKAAIDPYVIDENGVWRFDAAKNELVCVAAGDKRADSTLGQDFVAKAPVTLLLVADKARGAGIESFFSTDAGCMAMAVQLATEALGMGSVIRGSFDAAKMTAALGEDGAAKVPVLCVTLGEVA